MIKRCWIAVILIIALGLSFAPQISMLTAKVKQNTTGVVYAADVPIAGAYVSAEAADMGSGSGFAITDVSGQYSMTTGLTNGTYNVTAFAYGYIESRVDLVNVTEGIVTTDVNFNLEASGGISGTIRDAVSGTPISGANLYAELANGTGTFGWFGTTGADGTYLIATNLVTGTYNVTMFIAPEGYIRNMTTADVISGIETKNTNLDLDRSGIISGRVTDPNGTGLYNVTVAASSSDFSYFGFAETDLLGSYRITTGLATDNYTVFAYGDGNFTAYGGLLSPTEVPVTAGEETSGIDMELTPVTTPSMPSGTITGRVTDQQTSNPIPHASVSVSGSNGGGFNETDLNGYYSIAQGLGTGNDYNVSATATGYYDAYYPTLVSVTVNETTANIDIQMLAKPALNFGTITGTVMGAPNPIIPEFPNLLLALLPLTLVTAIAVKSILKVRRKKDELL